MDERVQRLDAEDDIIAVEHVVGVELIGCNGVHAVQVLHALPGRDVLASDDEQDLLAVRDLAEEGAGGLRGRSLTGNQFGDHVDALVAGPVGEGSAQGGGLHLLGGPLAVVARLRAVDGATTGELRCTGRALTSAAGALLAVRLLATAANLAAGLGGVGALTCSSELRDDNLVEKRDVGRRVEDLRGEIDGAVGLAAGDLDVQRQLGRRCLGAGHARAPPFTALLTITRPPLRPGIAPLISSRPFSASTL